MLTQANGGAFSSSHCDGLHGPASHATSPNRAAESAAFSCLPHKALTPVTTQSGRFEHDPQLVSVYFLSF